MPIVSIEMYAGRTDTMKKDASEAVTEALASALGIGRESISVVVKEITKDEYIERMKAPDTEFIIKEGKLI